MKDFTKVMTQSILVITQGKQENIPGPVFENLKSIVPPPPPPPPSAPAPPPPPPPGAVPKKGGLFSNISS